MIINQFVILFLFVPAVSFASLWSQKIIKEQNQKTLAQICENASHRIHAKVCKSIKKEELESKDKLKLTKLDNKTVLLKYNQASVRMRETSEPNTFLVNRKSLYLDEISSDQDLKKNVNKLLGSDNEMALTATLLFLYQNSEHQTCYEADRAVQNCTKVSSMDPSTLEKKSTQKLLSQGLQYSDSFKETIHFLSPSQTQSLKQCSCNKGVCGFPKEKNKTQTTISAYDQCKKSIQKLKKTAKDIDLFDDYAKKVLSLHIKEKQRIPALFKEDSYKGK